MLYCSTQKIAHLELAYEMQMVFFNWLIHNLSGCHRAIFNAK